MFQLETLSLNPPMVKAPLDEDMDVNPETNTFYALELVQKSSESLKYMKIMFPNNTTTFDYLDDLLELKKFEVHVELD